jgi:hypothetical protein
MSQTRYNRLQAILFDYVYLVSGFEMRKQGGFLPFVTRAMIHFLGQEPKECGTIVGQIIFIGFYEIYN